MRYCPNPDCPFLLEYGIVAEFQNSVSYCPDCGTVLKSGQTPKPEELRKNWQDTADPALVPFVTLAVFSSMEDAQFCLSHLLEARIPAVVDDSMPESEDWQTSGSARGYAVVVRESDVPRALHILSAIEDFWEGEEEESGYE